MRLQQISKRKILSLLLIVVGVGLLSMKQTQSSCCAGADHFTRIFRWRAAD